MPRKVRRGGVAALIQSRIQSAPPLAQALLDALAVLPLPLQLSTLRRYYKITQEELAVCLKIPQTNLSRLEKEGRGHSLKLYERMADILRARVIISPLSTKLTRRS